ncbi:A24 family peptidase [Bacillus sp. FJAT-49736]|uniref:prepilin peptidase n=1 Tax=Bacillus sp. FJAT-49736 TaxID=2833582 RepID=UPI001BC9A790|nr:A24 family peptidase [Bacillus sp. FJAT-49736]MBS4173707.1 prepilin peptidase [Bacillus sp. FJAT-49736]
MYILLITLYALLLGSFFNVVGMRVPVKKSIVKPRSACSYCHKTLTPLELIPVLSYIIQGGKCRHCKGRLSPLYPLGELMTAILFVYAFIQFGWSMELVIAWTLISLLIIIFVSDIAYMLIPDKILLVFAGIFLMERIIYPLHPWWDSLLGAALAFLLLLAIAVISKGGMGGGDIKLFALLGFVLGLKLVLLTFFLATFYGAIIGGIGLLLRIFQKGKPIPFGPFIVMGALTSYFFYDEILAWYLSFF